MVAKWALVILVSVALLAGVSARAAGLTVGGVDDLGSGTADVLPPISGTAEAVEVTDLEWFLDTDPTKVFKLTVTFVPITATTFDAVHFALKGSSGVLQQKTFSNQEIDGTGGDANKVVWTLDTLELAADITKFAITIVDAD